MRLNRMEILPPLTLALLFLVTRAITYLMWLRPEANFVANDMSYYNYHLWHLNQGQAEVMVEYPVPAVWILNACYHVGNYLGALLSTDWQPFFSALLLLLDAAVAASLYRRQNFTGALFWIMFTAANGAIVWFRFDLLPAALVAWACLWLVARPALSGAFVAAGAAIKLWPAILIAPLLAPDPRRGVGRRRLTGFLTAGGVLGLAALAVAGLERNLKPLAWQSERGLQIESVPATPLMLARTYFAPGEWHIWLSEYNALEIAGPGVGVMLTVSTALTLLSLLAAVGLSVLLIKRRSGPTVVLLAVCTLVLFTVIANKTLSPQYVLWLGGPVAVLLAHVRCPWLRRHLVVLGAALVVVGALTQYTYPWGAFGIMALPQGSGADIAVLAARNLLLIVLTAYSGWLTVKTAATADKSFG
ncbi:glycosyltransferase family 87 protein [Tessaracoccus sp. OH4464_COT-324]|uniref:glycosyltransferase family 87 protein n=1 Tax=Tessaracoccus sp. OH4464_COT-324 TaxID=2491059 RepID=UPI000F64418C|nr:glycosyltransferase family 87 protein [Tessaracoccus sp. OH4464_COT-324]RRD47873.1 DUF2029 domain-containing protein [Tessaracoccus sp. OH4464_COT-324]